jgi:hypothetical protein
MLVLLEILIIRHLLPDLLHDILSVPLDELSRLITNFMQNILGFLLTVSSPIVTVYLAAFFLIQ